MIPPHVEALHDRRLSGISRDLFTEKVFVHLMGVVEILMVGSLRTIASEGELANWHQINHVK